jgi:Dolichyl-phosphate-mannose-protein mannosyltransferase
MNNKYFQNFLFFFLLIGLCIYFDYMHIATLPPLGQHAWRQTDGASQTLNYYQFGLNFFKPEVHNIVLDGGASVGEFPILYYISALFMHVFGAEAWVIRLVHLVVFGVGLWFLFKILRGVSGHWIFALGGSLVFFTLPVMVFYAFNFLPNAPALGLIFISWWYFYQFYIHQRTSQLAFSMVFMALAGLLKPTMLISFCVILGIWLLEILRGSKKRTLFNKPFKVTWAFLIVLLPILTWRLWADSHSNSELFLNKPLPIWEASQGQNAWTWTWLYEFWFKKITFTPSTYLFLSLIVSLMLLKNSQFGFG